MIYKVKKVNHPHDIVTSILNSSKYPQTGAYTQSLHSQAGAAFKRVSSDDSETFIDALIRLGFSVLVDGDKRKKKIYRQ